MANLHDIERRINSVESTKQITRTMQMVAAAKIRHSMERVEHATPYRNAMYELLSNLSLLGETNAKLTKPHDEIKNTLLIVVRRLSPTSNIATPIPFLPSGTSRQILA